MLNIFPYMLKALAASLLCTANLLLCQACLQRLPYTEQTILSCVPYLILTTDRPSAVSLAQG